MHRLERYIQVLERSVDFAMEEHKDYDYKKANKIMQNLGNFTQELLDLDFRIHNMHEPLIFKKIEDGMRGISTSNISLSHWLL
eukprot:CAMPEP_0168313190 /NCGR_PEP_ID=MMETSP0210-20121227/286_1 /TAXON_ID=40633 /ORGANISM="Condylostoma magnum, Strain COL2" /LENGTH=82 /DNA_ID=CAMNT_0008266685 /DNA_START=86 /DNA_END=334 /DNA_ORIENTATION=+